MMLSDTARFRQAIIDDYQGALIRLATLRANDEQHLLFAWLELFPFDMNLPSGWRSGATPWTVPGSNGWTCAFTATRLTTVEALDWYEAAANGSIDIGPDKERQVRVGVVPLGPEPIYGRFCIPVDAPFTFRWHGTPRIHRYVPLTAPPQPVRELGRNAAACKWLERNLGFDPYRFDEWLGGLALVAPDPLCSAVEVFRSAGGADGAETLTVYAVPRRSEVRGVTDISGVSIHVGERRIDGWSSIHTCAVDESGVTTIAHPQSFGEIAYAMVCPKRGLLRFVGPHSWVEQMVVGMNAVNARVRVEVPSGGRRKPSKEIEILRHVPGADVVVGEPLKDIVRRRLIGLRERRKQREGRAGAPQKLFGIVGDKATASAVEIDKKRREAEQFVSEIVSSARRRVIFVDSFFGDREMRLFAFRNSSHEVVPRILTGLPALTAGVESSDHRPGDQFVADLEQIDRNSAISVPQVRVMPGGRTPVIHDRYLIVDDKVWHCGPSFNELGERLGIMVRLPDPLTVRRLVSKVWCRSSPISEFWQEYTKHAGDKP